MGFETAAPFVALGVTPAELGALLRACVRPELVSPSGALEPLGVIAGVVSAMVTRVSCAARLKWF